MNAYELADWLENWENNQEHDDEAANMLRQQADRIAELEKELETCKTIVALSNIAWKNMFGDDK